MRASRVIVAVVLSSAGWSSLASAAGPPDLARRREYFYLLRPGITLAEIASDLGPPESSTEGTAVYRLDQGQVEITERDGLVGAVEHLDPGGGAVSQSLYWSTPAALRPSPMELEARERRLAEHDFRRLESWGSDFLRTERHAGVVFLLREGYLVLEPTSPLMGAQGTFANLVSRATVHGKDGPQVVWRLFESWAAVKPPYLTKEELIRRDMVLLHDGQRPAADLARKLGEPDGSMGSGIRYDQYYVRDGLLVLSSAVKGAKHLSQPGMEEQVTLAEWRERRRAAVGAH
jgi:hypothetical protein